MLKLRFQMPELCFQMPKLPFQKPELRFQMPELSFQMPELPFQIAELPFRIAEHPFQNPRTTSTCLFDSPLLEQLVASLLASSTLLQEDNSLFQTCQ